MEKKDLDWSGLDFGYRQTEKRYVTNFKNDAWDDIVQIIFIKKDENPAYVEQSVRN